MRGRREKWRLSVCDLKNDAVYLHHGACVCVWEGVCLHSSDIFISVFTAIKKKTAMRLVVMEFVVSGVHIKSSTETFIITIMVSMATTKLQIQNQCSSL